MQGAGDWGIPPACAKRASADSARSWLTALALRSSLHSPLPPSVLGALSELKQTFTQAGPRSSTTPDSESSSGVARPGVALTMSPTPRRCSGRAGA